MNDYTTLEQLVIQWGSDKGILAKSTPLRQLDKTQDEVNELREELVLLAANEGVLPGFESTDLNALREKVKDEIGDVFVTMILLAHMAGFSSSECLDKAYAKISKRTGKMINGQFVKDE